ncbi:MAG: hypothetical protein QNJ65_23880 [Xenococcaceae cyanobacterium MO_234.B1]|nr:hypothetical protein [Xenococcaceae cyanobacterium MO_234.B1]
MADPTQTEQQSSVNTILFAETVDLENEPQYIVTKRALIIEVLNFQGCFNAELLAPIPNIREEWITLIQFQSEHLLSQWLNSEAYIQAASRIEPYINTQRKQFLSNFNQQVSFLITTTVRPENEEKWLSWDSKINQAMRTFPGFVGSDIQPSTIKQKGDNKTWIVNFQFDSLKNLRNWLDSPERARLMEEGSGLYESSVFSQVSSGFGSWFDMKSKDGTGVASWKMPYVVEMALYTMLIGQAFLTPFVNEWFVLPVALLINSFYGCFLMHYFLVPGFQKLMNFWLLPKHNEQKKINPIGIVLCLIYLVGLAYFSVKVLFA